MTKFRYYFQKTKHGRVNLSIHIGMAFTIPSVSIQNVIIIIDIYLDGVSDKVSEYICQSVSF